MFLPSITLLVCCYILLLLSSMMVIEIQSFRVHCNRQSPLLSVVSSSSSIKLRSTPPLSLFSSSSSVAVAVVESDIIHGLSDPTAVMSQQMMMMMPVQADHMMLNQGMLLADSSIAPTAVGFLFIAIAIMGSLQNFLAEFDRQLDARKAAAAAQTKGGKKKWWIDGWMRMDRWVDVMCGWIDGWMWCVDGWWMDGWMRIHRWDGVIEDIFIFILVVMMMIIGLMCSIV